MQEIGKVMEAIGKESDNKVSKKTRVSGAEEGEEQARNAESIKGQIMAFTEQDPTSDINKTSPSHLPPKIKTQQTAQKHPIYKSDSKTIDMDSRKASIINS